MSITLARIFLYTVGGLMALALLTCGGFTYWWAATSQGFIEGPSWERGYDVKYARAFDRSLPQWSPDGRLIVFSHNQVVHTMALDGSRLRDVTSDDPPKWIWNYDDGFDVAQSPSISPAGSRIAYAAYKHDRWWLPGIEDHQWDIVTSKVEGSGRRRLTKSGGRLSPAWSPDGSHIAFTWGRRGVYVMDSDGSTSVSWHPASIQFEVHQCGLPTDGGLRSLQGVISYS